MTIATFDLEEWWQTLPCPFPVSDWDRLPLRAEVYTREYLSTLEDLGATSTFFVVGWYASKMPHLVRQIANSGHEVAVHSQLHQDVRSLGPRLFREDIRTAKETLQDILGLPVSGYRAPSFTITPESLWAFEILVEEGFSMDSSVTSAVRVEGGGFGDFPSAEPFRLSTPSGDLQCFPMPGFEFMGRAWTLTGGGYMRLAPEWLLRRALQNRSYSMTYLHPADFDSRRPVAPGTSWLGRFRQTARLGDLKRKIRAAHAVSPFQSIAQFVTKLDEGSLRSIEVNCGL